MNVFIFFVAFFLTDTVVPSLNISFFISSFQSELVQIHSKSWKDHSRPRPVHSNHPDEKGRLQSLGPNSWVLLFDEKIDVPCTTHYWFILRGAGFKSQVLQLEKPIQSNFIKDDFSKRCCGQFIKLPNCVPKCWSLPHDLHLPVN